MARGQKCPKVASLLYGKLEFADLKNLEEPQKCDFWTLKSEFLSWGPPQKCPKVASLLYGKFEFVDLKNLEEPQKCDFGL